MIDCVAWKGAHNSEGFAIQKVGKHATCLVIGLILRKKRGRGIRPGTRPGLLCGNNGCVNEDHVIEVRIPGANVNYTPPLSKGQKMGREAERPLADWDLEAIADEILNVPRRVNGSGRKTVESRRGFFSERELASKGRREIPFGDELAGFGYDSMGHLIHQPTYRDDYD